jgi:hypothetical protein
MAGFPAGFGSPSSIGPLFFPATDSDVNAFNEAFMAAMQCPWPLLALDLPQVVASGMTPPDLVNP